MTPMQQILLGVGAKKKTYIDDVFSTYVYKGNESARAINNGIDLSGKGGLVWVKSRNDTHDHHLVDTVRGANDILESNTTDAEATVANRITGFNSNGFNLGSAGQVNGTSAYKYSSWTFRKEPGFFDVVSWTGNGTNGRQISHNLASVPGCIMVKCTSDADNWSVYHRGLNSGITPEQYHMVLNSTNDEDTTSDWNDTAATSTNFTVGDGGRINANNQTYVAYLFAGGESTAATARSVDFDGTDDRLTLAASTDFAFGTGDFTVECWAKTDTVAAQGVWQISGTTGGLDNDPRLAVSFGSDGKFRCVGPAGDQWICGKYSEGQWYHIARVRASGVSKLYINGTEVKSFADTTNYAYQNLCINGYYSTSYLLDGEISNFRVVKGTAVYTSSFRPPTEPLTNITNTKLLCCNNSSTTGSTVTPGTITANGNPTASTNSPFDDPAAFKFGDSEEGIIKCGSYVGNGSSTGPEINLGFEPQWVMIKWTATASGNSEGWEIFDSMRGIVTDEKDPYILANTSGSESTGSDAIDLTPTGFKVTSQYDFVNNNGTSYVYLAIRRPDGYVGKPADAGTSVFAMDTGGNVSSIPNFDSGFPVDFALTKQPATTSDWYVTERLTGPKYVYTNATNSEASFANFTFDSNVGWSKNPNNDTWQSWMWKRHHGFDVVTWQGDGQSKRFIPHNLNKVPEMIWLKSRSDTEGWFVGHNAMNNGNSPFGNGYYMQFDTGAQTNDSTVWNENPTSEYFNVGSYSGVNGSNKNILAMLFASVDGISKCGVYNGSTSNLTLDLGFQPRLFICKQIDAGGSYVVFDSVRGMGSGNDSILQLNSNSSANSSNRVEATSSGITLYANTDDDVLPTNTSNKCIYYAHA